MDDDRTQESEVPLADLTPIDAPRARNRRARRRRIGGAIVVVGFLAAGAVLANANDARHDPKRADTRPGPGPSDHATARVAVLSALHRTTASKSFTISFRLSAAPGRATSPPTDLGKCPPPSAMVACAYGENGPGMTISGHGTINLDPLAMVSSADVGSLGTITTWVDGTNAWEQGGGNYGMTPGGAKSSPISGFASLVTGTLGPREGAVAMNSLASPTGYLELAEAAITDTSMLGPSNVDGVAVTEYEVMIDSTKELDRPDMTSEERATAKQALALLDEQGYQTTSVRLAIDGNGYIRYAHAVVTFADGGSVTGDTSFSNFGCAGTVTMPQGEPTPLPTPTCAPPSTPAPSLGPVPETTPATSTPDTTVGGSAVVCRNSTDPACGPFRYDPPPANAPATLDVVKIEPAAPTVGERVTFTLHASDPDSLIFESSMWCNGGGYSFGEIGTTTTQCIADCAGPPGYGAWDPPAPRPGDLTFSLYYKYAQPGDYPATFSLNADICGPRPSNATASVTVHVAASTPTS